MLLKLIDQLGGASAIANWLNHNTFKPLVRPVTVITVCQWRHHGKLPDKFIPAIERMANERLTPEQVEKFLPMFITY